MIISRHKKSHLGVRTQSGLRERMENPGDSYPSAMTMTLKIGSMVRYATKKHYQSEGKLSRPNRARPERRIFIDPT